MSRHPDLESEQAYIDRAYEYLEQARLRAVNLRSMVEVGRGGTTQARYERDVIEEQILNRLSRLQLGSASLIFGRIDTESGERFHIGRLAVADEHQEPVVVDWRAPVAEAFYRATGRDPMGLVLRRHFVSRGRELIDIEDELFDLDRLDETYQGHGALVAALEQNRDGQLRDIVATIQGEQDEIIRHELKGTVVVQGGPGTGKTVVALHRAAYLLYTHRFPLEGQGVLVIGPNRLFLRYIERVLPSLGEAGVHLTVLADLLSDLFPDTRVTLVDNPEQAAVKGDPLMVELIREAVRDRERPLREELTVDYGVTRLRLPVAETRRIVKEARRRFRHHNAARRFVETEVFTALAQSHRTRPDPATVAARLEGDAAVRAALEHMWPVLSPHELLRDLFGSAALLRSAATRAVTAEGRMADWRSLRRDRGPDLASYAWSDADVPLLDEAHVLLGPHPDRRREEEIRTYGHIVVDEAQDHTPMALRMIARRSLNGSLTLVGDIAQATSPGAADSWDDVLAHLPTGPVPPDIRELTLSYRIPGPNLRLALRILRQAAPGITPPVAVREKGERPVIRRVAGPSVLGALGETVRDELARLEGGSLAVIVPASMVSAAHRVLAEAGIEHGTATNASRNVTGRLHPRVAVVPVNLVKGLELDGSIVVEPSLIVAEEPQGLRALYVAMTRSTKRLVVLHGRPLPECLTESTGPEVRPGAATAAAVEPAAGEI